MTSHRTRSRDSRLGRFVSKATALLHPDTTVTETVHDTVSITITQEMVVAATLVIRVRSLWLDEAKIHDTDYHAETALRSLTAALKAAKVNR